jgi:hypothetical protein
MPFDGTGFDPVYEALDRAEAIIRRDGWRKAAPGKPGAPRCVIGAIQQAVDEIEFHTGEQRWHHLRWETCRCYGVAIGMPSVEIWNDRPECSLADVLDGFKRAKARALERRVAV